MIRDLLKDTFEKIRGKDEPSVKLYCVNSSSNSEVTATEKTDPLDKIFLDQGYVICTYGCPHCGELHSYLWGTPTPLAITDSSDFKFEFEASVETDFNFNGLDEEEFGLLLDTLRRKRG